MPIRRRGGTGGGGGGLHFRNPVDVFATVGARTTAFSTGGTLAGQHVQFAADRSLAILIGTIANPTGFQTYTGDAGTYDDAAWLSRVDAVQSVTPGPAGPPPTAANVDPIIAAYMGEISGLTIPETQIPAVIARDTEISTAISNLRGGVDAAYDTLAEIADRLVASIVLSPANVLTITREGGDTLVADLSGLASGGLSQAQIRALIQIALEDATTGNVETGITVTTQSDGTVDFVVTGGGGITLAQALAGVMAGAGLAVDRTVDGQITLSSTVTQDGVVEQVGSGFDADTGVLTLARSGTLGNITITGFPTSSGAPPVTRTEQIHYGIAASISDLANLDISGFTTEDASIASHTITLGPTTAANEYAVIFAPSDHDILTLVNTALQSNDLTSFSKTENVRTLNSESYDSYTLGPLHISVSLEYQMTLQE